jgi:zinc/manganese transport system permease protein
MLGYSFAQNALLAGILVAVVAGLVSRFVVARNMSFAVHALAEVGFTGSTGFILIGLSPVLGLLSGSMLTALFIGTLAVVAVVTLVGLGVMYRPLTFATVDPIVAEARGVPVRLISILFLLILAAAVAEAVQVVGVLLILTLLITPGATAERLTAQPGLATVASISVALLSTVGGILLALVTTVPVSFYVTTIAFVCYLAARLGIPAIERLRGMRAE